MKKVFIFGNEDLKEDNLPILILPELQEKFPKIKFEIKDPNEEWEIPDELIILDTAVGIKEITIFDNLKNFSKTPRVGIHDFDALTNLKFLQKLGKIGEVKVIAVPLDIQKSKALKKIINILSDRTFY